MSGPAEQARATACRSSPVTVPLPKIKAVSGPPAVAGPSNDHQRSPVPTCTRFQLPGHGDPHDQEGGDRVGLCTGSCSPATATHLCRVLGSVGRRVTWRTAEEVCATANGRSRGGYGWSHGGLAGDLMPWLVREVVAAAGCRAAGFGIGEHNAEEVVGGRFTVVADPLGSTG